MTKKLFIKIKFTVFIFAILISCSKNKTVIDNEIAYWNNQIETLTLIGPYKNDVLVWVKELDPFYKVSDLKVIAQFSSKNAGVQYSVELCTTLVIFFNSEERVINHKVKVTLGCANLHEFD